MKIIKRIIILSMLLFLLVSWSSSEASNNANNVESEQIFSFTEISEFLRKLSTEPNSHSIMEMDNVHYSLNLLEKDHDTPLLLGIFTFYNMGKETVTTKVDWILSENTEDVYKIEKWKLNTKINGNDIVNLCFAEDVTEQEKYIIFFLDINAKRSTYQLITQ
ncbi:MAG: hypothetical protein KAX49_12655 [Halanaerobiales bacterium]|nr:hypothetical protein [Halanaerobiales bacterium]